jgi:hypothetical protein
MEQDLQTILDAIERHRSETDANFQSVRAETDANFQAVRAEMDTNFQAVRTQLSTLESGVLTMAQKLLADDEVTELRAKMRKVG